jgi:plastocyanin
MQNKRGRGKGFDISSWFLVFLKWRFYRNALKILDEVYESKSNSYFHRRFVCRIIGWNLSHPSFVWRYITKHKTEIFIMHKLLSSFIIITAGILLIGIIGCKDNSSNPAGPSSNNPPANTNTITMAGNSFSPAIDTIAVNSTVTWNNTSGVAHTSTSDTGAWDTGNIPAGSSKTTTFNTVGTFHYHCTYHSGMVAAITVR